ncbi:uncharacterized protein THITE_2169457 [Thermothielavioides terrestris NRRL 8126]|uniref:Uncharacterized protein n=1 Tax=Thermothielavioides terrestris (strain ATCC 38088 / NRRL 8126) TaxID=578455 RepID=G2QS36_THETT|nr:uncharacterized protein THITE_2169457 [Thermothielavioides terrestris NRRL 8126]AEO63426.1 hypothetical protein THITE_2169457 [Thermothielavioides terrestris NRRL 8126]
MSGNVVKAFVTTGAVIKGAKSLTLGVATQTSFWNRPESAITESMKSGFKAAVERDTRALPAEADKIVMREPEHGDDNHYTAVLLDADGNYLESRHY